MKSCSNVKVPEPPKKWHPPPENHFWLDVDAAINERLNLYSIAGVIRNHDGNLVLAFGTRIMQPISVTRGEILALQEGLQLVYERGFEGTHIYSDPQMVVQAVMDPSSDYGYIGLSAQEIKDQIKLQLPWIISLTHMNRSANLVAHSLAQFVISSPTPFCWVNGDFPSWLVDIVSRNNTYE